MFLCLCPVKVRTGSVIVSPGLHSLTKVYHGRYVDLSHSSLDMREEFPKDVYHSYVTVLILCE